MIGGSKKSRLSLYFAVRQFPFDGSVSHSLNLPFFRDALCSSLLESRFLPAISGIKNGAVFSC